MTYNLKLDEREFGILLNSISAYENFGIIKPVSSKYDEDVVNIDFNDLLEYGNAYMIKYLLYDEKKDYRKLNCETHIKQCEKDEHWIDGYEKSNYGVRKIKHE